jgi:pyruvate-formate lyase
MIRHALRKRRQESIQCQNIYCNNISCKLDVLEKKVIQALEIWTENYKLKIPESPEFKEKENIKDINNSVLNRINSGLKELEKQSENIHDLLERGVYDIPKFLERQKIISEKKEKLQKEKEEIRKALALQKEKHTNKTELGSKIKKIMDVYSKLSSPKQKNDLLKEVVDKIIYNRETGGRWVDTDNFEIELYLKI